MLFVHTINKVLSGEKTATRRLIKSGEYQRRDFDLPDAPIRQVAYTPDGWVGSDSKVRYWLGQTLAAQPGRGKSAVARIRIEAIERDDDVRDITAEEARAEGFDGRAEFMMTWTNMHDKAFQFAPKDRGYGWLLYEARKGYSYLTEDELLAKLAARPAERYAAWAIKFALIDGRDTDA